MKKRNASLESSFWNAAARIGVVPYLFEFFTVHYCRAVEAEICSTDPEATPLIYPQAMLFRVFQEDRRLHPAEPKKPLELFGKGEAAAIALAWERGWDLLINDFRPLQYARGLGIPCVSVPQFVVLIFEAGRITREAALGYLDRLAPVTRPALIAEAKAAVERLHQEREQPEAGKPKKEKEKEKKKEKKKGRRRR